MLKELPSSVCVTSALDKKTLNIELGALYTMTPEYPFSPDDISHCDILVCMPVFIDKRPGRNHVSLFLVGYEHDQLIPTIFKNGYLSFSYDNESGDNLAIHISSYDLQQTLLTRPRSGSQVIRIGPLIVPIFDFTMQMKIDDFAHALMTPLGSLIKDMRKWPRRAVEAWIDQLELEPDQRNTAMHMDQKYKMILYAQEMFTHHASDFNKVAAKKVKEGRPEKVEKSAKSLWGDVDWGDVDWGNVDFIRVPDPAEYCTEYAVEFKARVPQNDLFNNDRRTIFSEPPGIQFRVENENFFDRSNMTAEMVGYDHITPSGHHIIRIRLLRFPKRVGLDRVNSVRVIAEVELVARGATENRLHLTRAKIQVETQSTDAIVVEQDDIAVVILSEFIFVRIKNYPLAEDQEDIEISLDAVAKLVDRSHYQQQRNVKKRSQAKKDLYNNQYAKYARFCDETPHISLYPGDVSMCSGEPIPTQAVKPAYKPVYAYGDYKHIEEQVKLEKNTRPLGKPKVFGEPDEAEPLPEVFEEKKERDE